MKKFAVTAFIFLICCMSSHSQLLVCKHLTNPYSTLLSSIVPTNDNGFIIAGSTTSFGAGSYDMYLLKIDSLYNLQWTKTIGDTADDKAVSIIQTFDGGYVLTGGSNDQGGNSDLIIVKVDAAGNYQWSRAIGGPSVEFGFKIIQLSDSNYLAVGNTFSYGKGSVDAYVVKISSSGNILWTRTVGGQAGDMGLTCMENSNGEYVVSGIANSAGTTYMSLFKLDAAGNLIWSKGIGEGLVSICYGITGTSDGGYMMVGALVGSVANSAKIYIVRTDSVGNIIWTKITGGSWDERLFSVIKSHDGYYYSAGRALTDTAGIGTYIFRVMKWDENGNVMWTKGVDNNYASTNIEIAEGADGHFIIPGSGPLSPMFFTLDNNGNGCCAYDYITPDTVGGSEVLLGLLDSGGVITQRPWLFSDGGALVTDCSTTPVTNEMDDAENFNVYPNPAKEELIVSSRVSGKKQMLELFNITGQPVYHQLLISEKQIIPVKELARGIYILKAGSGNGIIVRKVILQ